jgi:hypothetical protein
MRRTGTLRDMWAKIEKGAMAGKKLNAKAQSREDAIKKKTSVDEEWFSLRLCVLAPLR